MTLPELITQEKYSEAFSLLKSQPENTAQHYYNLGTLAFRLGKVGHSYAYLSKAHSLNPKDSDIQENLDLAREIFFKSTSETSRAELSRSWLDPIAEKVTFDELRGMIGVFGILMLFFWVRVYSKTLKTRSLFQDTASWIGMIAFFVTISLYGIKKYSESFPTAIVLESARLKTGPDPSFTEITTLEPGNKVRVKNTTPTSGWYQVEFAKGGRDQIGWISLSSVLLLNEQ